jgi:hypothetical protein
MEKGDKSLASGNITVARYATERGRAGLGELSLGGTYDPAELEQLNVGRLAVGL